jgi:hypothetical protein
MASEKPSTPKLPFAVGDRAAFIRKAAVALEVVNVPTVRVVTYCIPYNRVEVIEIPLSRIAAKDVSSKDQYYVDGGHVSGGTLSMAKTHLSWLRSQALNSGATPDAIRLLSKATSAFTKKEEKEMAEKLKAKASPKKADTEGLKTAAKKTPVGGKSKGNAAALAKARAAKGPDNRKIKALIKPKAIEAREGTFRREMLEALLSSRTVQEFRDKNPKYDAGCLAYAQKAGIVSVA